MTKHIGLREAVSLLNNTDDVMSLVDNPELIQFMDDVQDAGQNVLATLDQEYLLGAIGFLKSSSIAGLISVGGNPLLAMTLLESGDYERLVTILFKFCVGLSVIEELR